MEFSIRIPYPKSKLTSSIKTATNTFKLAELIRKEEMIQISVVDRMRYQDKYFLL